MVQARSELEAKLKDLPAAPGVYLLKDAGGQVIYVGKAVSLRNRVRSYFQKGTALDPKTRKLVEKTLDLDYLVTDSEMEALILESNLIKEHQPRYNILLKDDKQYPYIKITLQEPYPRIYLERRLKKDGSRYFGPFTSVGAVRSTLDLLHKIFPFRSCNQNLEPGRSRGRPCLNYQINRCLAPCRGSVSPEDYRQVVMEVIAFLEGKREKILKSFKENMSRAASGLDFEAAARWRDRLQALEAVMQRQKVVDTDLMDRDVVALVRSGKEKEASLIQVLFLREGKLVGKEQFFLKNTAGAEDGEVLASFLQQFYGPQLFVPREILLSRVIEGKELLEKWLGSLRGGRVTLRTPQRGEKKKLVALAEKNALLFLQQREALSSRRAELALAGLEELAQLLDLPFPPHRIEGYDISNIQGEKTVASGVVFTAGEPDKAEYRRYRIKTVTGPDDYASIREVIRRRFSKGKEGGRPLPDLILIDGGKGQLQAARRSLTEAGIDLPLISLAKEEEVIFREGTKEPLKLPPTSPALRLLQQVRDESHRFALAYHRRLRDKEARLGSLDDIPGIGTKRKKALLSHFGSLDNVLKASTEELARVQGISKKTAQIIKDHLQSPGRTGRSGREL
ncbi:MAG TPA: excinuclease ABC subunit UvrC [Firmicutes bacterium]|nr:excinuclease ABC subunit UvrC [Bacillota bacterium]